MNQISNKLSVLQNNFKNISFLSAKHQHKLNDIQTTVLNIQSQEIEKIRQSYQNFGLNNQINKQNIKRISNGVYMGDIDADGKLQGFGTIKYNNGDVFYGNFRDGKAQGKGLIYYANGQYYVGDFVNNNFQGKGFYYTNELTYRGQFKNNLFQGNGELNMRHNNSKFSGQMQNGQMMKGTFEWRCRGKSFTYRGEFKNNKFNDINGVLTAQNGVYKGQFRNGVKQGKGRFQYSQHYQYMGEYQNNLKNGQGTLYNPEIKMIGGKQIGELNQLKKNISYRGNFRNNIPHGKGAIYDKVTDMLREAEYEDGIWTELISKNSSN